MRRVKGWFSCRPIGCFDYDFFVDDDTSYEEIERKIDDMLEISSFFEVEDGYEAYNEIIYHKKAPCDV